MKRAAVIISDRIHDYRTKIDCRSIEITESKDRLRDMEISGRRGPAQGKMNRLRQEIFALERAKMDDEIVLAELENIFCVLVQDEVSA